MTVDQLVILLAQSSPMGMLVGYLIWRENCDRKERKADIASREALASALAGLTMVIQGRSNV